MLVESTVRRGRYLHHLRKRSPANAYILAINVFCSATGNSVQAYDTSLQMSVNDIVLKAVTCLVQVLVGDLKWLWKVLIYGTTCAESYLPYFQ